MRDQLCIFVKAPRDGSVKTRLASSIGAEPACLAYKTLVERLLGNLKPLQNVDICYSPDDAHGEIRPWLQHGWTSSPQGHGDLGVRLETAFKAHFSGARCKVVVIGSDCPYVMTSDIHAAWSALEEVDLVLGPAEDGGYWLIGLREPQESLFRDMTWSSPSVLNETLNRARAAGLVVRTLRTLEDVDTLAEWDRFQRSLSGGT